MPNPPIDDKFDHTESSDRLLTPLLNNHDLYSSSGVDATEVRAIMDIYPKKDPVKEAIIMTERKIAAAPVIGVSRSGGNTFEVNLAHQAHLRETGVIQSSESSLQEIILADKFMTDLINDTYEINFQFARFLYTNNMGILEKGVNDVENETDKNTRLRKYLFHISRHASVLSGTVVPKKGLFAGSKLLRMGADKKFETRDKFKEQVNLYVEYLDAIRIHPNGANLKFDSKISAQIRGRLNNVHFRYGEVTDPDTPSVANDNAPTQTGSPKISVPELHNRKLCVPCRRYLTGWCSREPCNFCHNPQHEAEHPELVSQRIKR